MVVGLGVGGETVLERADLVVAERTGRRRRCRRRIAADPCDPVRGGLAGHLLGLGFETSPAVRCPRFFAILRWAFLGVLLTSLGCRPGSQVAFSISVDSEAVYRVSHEDLVAAGLGAETVLPSAHLGLTSRDYGVPIWVVDGGDGRFGPGDHFEFLGEPPAGHRSAFHEHTLLNSYRLTTDAKRPRRMVMPALTGPAADEDVASLFRTEHLEHNEIVVHFPSRHAEDPEPRFWRRLTSIDAEPFTVALDLDGYDRRGPIQVKIHLQGWSRQTVDTRVDHDHRVEVLFNGASVGAEEWNGRQGRTLQVELPAQAVQEEQNLLSLLIPERRGSAGEEPIADAVLLDWITLRYPATEKLVRLPAKVVARRSAESSRRLPPLAGPMPVRFSFQPGARWLAFSSDGARYDHLTNMAFEDREGETVAELVIDRVRVGKEVEITAMPRRSLRSPVLVELDVPSDLRAAGQQADYLVITPPQFVKALEPLVALRRREGLAVKVVDVRDIYEEFSHGVVDPRAVRSFLAFSLKRWSRPQPRFVLLVGDASWQPEPERTLRGLMPTGSLPNARTPIPTDNFYAAVVDDDVLPDLAIGRLPVADEIALRRVVGKLVRYAEEDSVGPWKRRYLWVFDAAPELGGRVEQLFRSVGSQGLEVGGCCDPGDRDEVRAALVKEVERGHLVVHLLGHEVKRQWRQETEATEAYLAGWGSEDSFERVAEESVSWPLVLNMTRRSDAFDHPARSSVGEQLLLQGDGGAIGVLGPTRRVSGTLGFSRKLSQELLAQPTIGEAIQATKRTLSNRHLIEQMDYLGDPATRLALPPRVRGKLHHRQDAVRLTAELPAGLAGGTAIIDWLRGDGTVIATHREAIDGAQFSIRASQEHGVLGARAYFWHAGNGVDARLRVRLAGANQGGAL